MMMMMMMILTYGQTQLTGVEATRMAVNSAERLHDTGIE